jgi:hypothetical protein
MLLTASLTEHSLFAIGTFPSWAGLHDKGQESPALLKAEMNWPSLFGEGEGTLLPAETRLKTSKEREEKPSYH